MRAGCGCHQNAEDSSDHDTYCRTAPSCLPHQPTIRDRSMKNLLAIIGVIVVVKRGYEFFCEYNEMKRELDNRAGDSA